MSVLDAELLNNELELDDDGVAVGDAAALEVANGERDKFELTLLVALARGDPVAELAGVAEAEAEAVAHTALVVAVHMELKPEGHVSQGVQDAASPVEYVPDAHAVHTFWTLDPESAL